MLLQDSLPARRREVRVELGGTTDDLDIAIYEPDGDDDAAESSTFPASLQVRPDKVLCCFESFRPVGSDDRSRQLDEIFAR